VNLRQNSSRRIKRKKNRKNREREREKRERWETISEVRDKGRWKESRPTVTVCQS
jgi:hypothetical protein